MVIERIDDLIDDGNIVYTVTVGDPSSGDPVFDALTDADTADVDITNQDDDGAGFNVDSGTLDLETYEAGAVNTASFRAVLTAAPVAGAEVRIPISGIDTSEGTLTSPASGYFSFTDQNWDVYQTATITRVDDLIEDGDISYLVTVGPPYCYGSPVDPAYDGLDDEWERYITNYDDDVAGVTVTPSPDLITEEGNPGNTSSLDVVLDISPQSGTTVTIPIRVLDTSEGRVISPFSGFTGNLSFDNSDWNVPQRVTVRGVDDYIVDGPIDFTVEVGDPSSGDPAFNALDNDDTDDVTMQNLDNDSAEIRH